METEKFKQIHCVQTARIKGCRWNQQHMELSRHLLRHRSIQGSNLEMDIPMVQAINS